MIIVTLAVFLTVVQTAPPIPRKAADNSAQVATQVKNESTTKQAPALPSPAPLKTDSDGPPKTDSKEQRPNNAEHTVGISKLPPVSVTRDWADWGVWVFSLLLVVVGVLQVGLLRSTLGAIRRQADEMGRQVDLAFGQLRAMHEQITEMSTQTDVLEKSVAVAKESADATKDSVNTMKAKERARIVVELNYKGSFDFKMIKPAPFAHLLKDAEKGIPALPHLEEFKISILQVGQSHAFNVVGRADIQITPFRVPPPKDDIPPLNIPNLIKTGTLSISTGISFIISDEEFDGILNKKLFAHMLGDITYTDIFGDWHITPFRFIWHVGEQMLGTTEEGDPIYADLSGWESEGPEEDNTAT
jgi:hypothetical protein